MKKKLVLKEEVKEELLILGFMVLGFIFCYFLCLVF